MGGAFASDLIFFSTVRDERVSQTELRFLNIGGRMVWTGLLLIIVSGIIVFLSNPEVYLASDKFLVKMTVVGIIFLNGLVFHIIHLPRFHRHATEHFPSSDEFMRAVPFLLIGGVISSVSWFSAFILGLWKNAPYSYLEMLSVYLLVIFLGIIFAILMKKKFIPHSR